MGNREHSKVLKAIFFVFPCVAHSFIFVILVIIIMVIVTIRHQTGLDRPPLIISSKLLQVFYVRVTVHRNKCLYNNTN